MKKLRVFHNHRLVGEHDARCGEYREGADNTYHRRHEGNVLIIHEDGQETRYELNQWSAAGVDLLCAFQRDVGPADCPRCAAAGILRAPGGGTDGAAGDPPTEVPPRHEIDLPPGAPA